MELKGATELLEVSSAVSVSHGWIGLVSSLICFERVRAVATA